MSLPARRRHLLPLLLMTAVSLALTSPALAWGPSVHIRECVRAAELLAEEPGPLGQIGSPALRPWLALGCIAPDFRQTSVALSAIDTHSWKLGMQLLEAAQLPGAPTQAVAFAFGHLAHHAGDAAESVYAARLAASALLGAPDLFEGISDEGYGECEMWVEVLGEFANGDTDALVQLLGDMGVFDGPAADWAPIIVWYVQTANTWYGKQKADPQAVVADLLAVVAKAKKTLGGMSPAAVTNLLGILKKGKPSNNVQLLSKLPIGDALAAFGIQIAEGLDPVRWGPLSRLAEFDQLELWHTAYAAPFADLGPTWAVSMALGGKLDPDWPPSHSSLAMQAGARVSLAWGMPAGSFTPQNKVLADFLGFFTPQGKPLQSSLPGAGPVTVRAKVFATEPLQTWVALRVHSVPGTVETVDLGTAVTATAALLQVDPKGYFSTAGRLELSITFDVPSNMGQARGLVIALAQGDTQAEALAAPPFLHGNWNLYQAHNLLDLTGPVYDPHHYTWDGWPWGLQLPAPQGLKTGSLIVRVLEAPAGNLLPLPQAALRATPKGPVLRQLQGTPGGRLLADGLTPPEAWLELTGGSAALSGLGADGWPAPLSLPFAVTAGQISLGEARAWVLPEVAEAHWLPASSSETPATVRVELQPLGHYGDQPMQVEFRVATQSHGPAVWPAPPAAHVVQLSQTSAEDTDPGHLAYLLPVGPWPANGAPALVQLRLVYASSAAAVGPETLRGPWVEEAVLPPKPTSPVEGPDAGPQDVEDALGADDAASSPDSAAVEASPSSSPVASEGASGSRGDAGGCQSAPVAGPGWPDWCAVMCVTALGCAGSGARRRRAARAATN